ncbi:hypothetical protein A2U01_0091660, partial [Trifolium medium]|nr:hypothetical protein [Trifolium medium]
MALVTGTEFRHDDLDFSGLCFWCDRDGIRRKMPPPAKKHCVKPVV